MATHFGKNIKPYASGLKPSLTIRDQDETYGGQIMPYLPTLQGY